jgi:hypothetical protein
MTPTFMTVSSDRGAVQEFARRPFFTDLNDAASGRADVAGTLFRVARKPAAASIS